MESYDEVTTPSARWVCKCESDSPGSDEDSRFTIYRALVSEAITAYHKNHTVLRMPPHLVHYLPDGFMSTFGIHDRGYNNKPIANQTNNVDDGVAKASSCHVGERVDCMDCKCDRCSTSRDADAAFEIYRTLVSLAIRAYHKAQFLREMPQHLIAYLPAGFLTAYGAHDIDLNWDKLPLHLRMSADVAACRPCRRHFMHRGDSHCDWDGPNPMIKNCKRCTDNFMNKIV